MQLQLCGSTGKDVVELLRFRWTLKYIGFLSFCFCSGGFLCEETVKNGGLRVSCKPIVTMSFLANFSFLPSLLQIGEDEDISS